MTLANTNNNPGDLRLAGQTDATQGQGGFADFPTPQDGQAALLNDVQSKINKSPNETLAEFSSVYAPEEDGNNPAEYTANLANQLGVNPDASIGSLEPEIGKFADAIAKNEGYNYGGSGVGGIVNSNTAGQIGSTAGEAYNAVGGAPGALAIGGVGAGLAAGGLAALPEEALSGIEGLGSSVVNGIEDLFGKKSSNSGSSGNTSSDISSTSPQTVAGLLGGQTNEQSGQGQNTGNKQEQISNPTVATESPQQPQTTPQEPQNNYSTPAQPSDTYSTLQNMLGSMVGGQQVMQEGKARGIDPIAVLEQSGASSLLQPDENGNIDKEAPTNFLNGLISKDKSYQRQGLSQMTSPTDLGDMQSAAEAEIDKAMADTGERERAKKEVKRIFDDYRAEQPKKKDKNGKEFISNFVSPERLQKKKELLSVNQRDFARPQHERAAAAHVKEAMRKRLSLIAKQDGIKGWMTNKRMEAHILAKNAIKKLPKKAARNKTKEFTKDLLASVAGGLIAKAVGSNSLVGTVAGHLIETKLGNREYQKIGSKEDRKKGERNMYTPLHGLISREKPRQK